MRVPSFQVSQWRTKRRSKSIPLAFAFSFSSSAFFVSAGDFPGKTSIERSEVLPAGGDLELVDVERQARDLLGLAALEREAPDLRGAAARREEVEDLPSADQRGCESPASCVVRRRTPRAVGRGQVRSVRPRFASRSVVADDERDLRAVGGDLGVGDPVHGEHVVDGEGVGLGGRAREGEGQEQDEGER